MYIYMYIYKENSPRQHTNYHIHNPIATWISMDHHINFHHHIPAIYSYSMILPVIPVSYLAQQESHHSEHHFPIFSMALAIGPRLKNSDALLTDTRDVGVACPVTWNWWMRRMEGLEAKQKTI